MITAKNVRLGCGMLLLAIATASAVPGVYLTTGDSLLRYDLNTGFVGVVGTFPGATRGSFSDLLTTGPGGRIYSLGNSGIWQWDVGQGTASQIITFGPELTAAPGGMATSGNSLYLTVGDSLLQYDPDTGAFIGIVGTFPGATRGSLSDLLTSGPGNRIYSLGNSGVWQWNVTKGTASEVITFGAEVTSTPGGLVSLHSP